MMLVPALALLPQLLLQLRPEDVKSKCYVNSKTALRCFLVFVESFFPGFSFRLCQTLPVFPQLLHLRLQTFDFVSKVLLEEPVCLQGQVPLSVSLFASGLG